MYNMYNITNDIIKLVKPRFESILNILIQKKVYMRNNVIRLK